ncbi:MAG: hypothetical protein EBT35_05860 [Alphaproteobacteria bacterium]|jgi:hypothetical protein|nr:hypothetical protein [Alphaproteobacteria bacterium]
MIGNDSLKRLKDAGKVNWTSWREAIERELDYISKTQDYFGGPSSETIHAIRKSIKFVKALLILAPPSIAKDTKVISIKISKTSKRLSKIRNRHVHLQVLGQFTFARDSKEKITLTDAEFNKLKKAQKQIEKISLIFNALPTPGEDKKQILSQIERQIKRTERKRPKNWNARKIKSIHKYRTALICENNQLLFLNSLTGRPSVKKLKRLDLHRQMLGQVNDLSQSINKLKASSSHSRHELSIIRKLKDRRKQLFEKLAYKKT